MTVHKKTLVRAHVVTGHSIREPGNNLRYRTGSELKATARAGGKQVPKGPCNSRDLTENHRKSGVCEMPNRAATAWRAWSTRTPY